MNTMPFLILLFFLISSISSSLTSEQRKSLLKKVTKNISFSTRHERLNQYYERERGISEMKYEASKIKELIDANGFPESYNFITAESPDVNIKDQGYCGSCWAFASTTALAYRFHKKGINVNLSPQHSISCYISDCEIGDYLIDTALNLVKNGTVTEECLPYNSGYGINLESCPTKCKNGDDLVKYYAKSAYTTEEDYTQENFYDIVTVIIDQLITYGPVESGIIVYSDFKDLNNKKNCKNIIYKVDSITNRVGGHAVVIVGYGVENNRYYWIVQNSWGKSFCDGGFAKIEFGQINVESVSFAEAYVDDNFEGNQQISINIKEISDDCRIKFDSSEEMNGAFEMYYENSEDFYFQCSPVYLKEKEGICSYNIDSIYLKKGIYKYREHESLLNNDTYNINFNSINKEFNFYGVDYIDSFFYGKNYYVSQEGNTITLYLEESNNESKTLNEIYPNKDATTGLSNCKKINIDDFYSIIHCTLTSNEIKNFPESNKSPLAYDIFCGQKELMAATVNNFNSNKYPIYRIKQFLIPEQRVINYYSRFLLVADVEGSLSRFNTEEFDFGVYVQIEESNDVHYEMLICYSYSPIELQTNFLIYCNLNINKNKSYIYNNIYLTPYVIPIFDSDPFQIIIKNKLKGEEYEDDDDDDIVRFTSYLIYRNVNLSLIILLSLIIYLF